MQGFVGVLWRMVQDFVQVLWEMEHDFVGAR